MKLKMVCYICLRGVYTLENSLLLVLYRPTGTFIHMNMFFLLNYVPGPGILNFK